MAETANKVLTLAPKSPYASGSIRFRVYGTNTVCNASIVLAGNTTDQAQSDGTVLANANASGTQTYNGIISGDGGFISRGTGVAILNGVNTYAGGTTPTAGAIGLGNNAALGTGPLNLAAETPNTTGSGTVFAAGGSRTIANLIQYPGGTNNQPLIITITNLGATLQVGDTFTLFSKAMSNGAAMTVTGGGVNWTNKLALDGSIKVLSLISTINTNAFTLTNSISGNVLTLSWPVDHTGYRLQAQTNSLSNGLGTNWATIPGSASVNSTNFTINPANGSVFYRLIYP